ncbi:hypothetical protein LOK49_LG13G00695, partial [Camellia lanceoleosa]
MNLPPFQLVLSCTRCILQHVEVPVPAPKKGEVMLKLEATSLNPVDWKIQKGILRPLFPRKFPCIPAPVYRIREEVETRSQIESC